jgi:hypothetical protein
VHGTNAEEVRAANSSCRRRLFSNAIISMGEPLGESLINRLINGMISRKSPPVKSSRRW